MNLTADTVTPDTLAEGITAHDKAGKAITGTMTGGTDTTIGQNPITSDKVLSGYKGYANGTLITGNIPSKSASTYIPTTSDQTIADGQYLSGTQTISGDANLTAGNIKSGVSIFGVAGTYEGSSGGIEAVNVTISAIDCWLNLSGTYADGSILEESLDNESKTYTIAKNTIFLIFSQVPVSFDLYTWLWFQLQDGTYGALFSADSDLEISLSPA